MKQKWNSVVFIDLDNTLIEGPFESIVFPLVFQELSEKSGFDLAEIRRQVVEENFSRQKRSDISPVLAMDWDDIFVSVAKRLGVRLKTNALEIVRSHSTPPYSVMLENANEILQQLSKPSRAIVATTKGLKKYQLPILDNMGLLPLFTALLTPDTNNALKKDIAFYGDWINQASLQTSVGDHYADDIAAPKSFGFRAIWKLNQQHNELGNLSPFERPENYDFQDDQLARPDAIIISLRELPSVVDQIEKEGWI